MGVVTKQYLREMVTSMLSGGDSRQAMKYPPKMVEAFLQQAINRKLRLDHISVTLPGGDTIPEGLNLACYDGIPVTKYKGVSRAKLPAAPVSLMRNIGVFFVGPHIGTPVPGGGAADATYFIIEGVVGGTVRVIGTNDPVSGIADGSTMISSDVFAGMHVRVVRGNLVVPGIDPMDGGMYFDKVQANDFIALSQPLINGEYFRVEGFVPIVPAIPDYIILEARVDQNIVQLGAQDPVFGITDGSYTVSCPFFANRQVRVTRGSVILPGVDPGDGSDYYIKNFADDYITYINPLVRGEYIKIETL